MASRRRLARTTALQTIFEAQCRTIDGESALKKNIHDQIPEEVDEDFALELFQGVQKNEQEMYTKIAMYAPEWPVDRMDTMTRSILLIATYELLFMNDTPSAVIMNEAIELAKQFGPDESPKFVNGVLNSLSKAVRSS